MSASDKRVAELLDRWLASVELHARYLELDDAAYARVQNWPKHQRPTKWIVELARARLLELKRQLAERGARGDAEFAESLELMGFLTTLLGSEHLERFVPQAAPRPRAAPVPPPETAGGPKASSGDTTKRQNLAPRPQVAAQPASAPKQRTAARPKVSHQLIATVMADAVRFLSWGREWPQLASSIARLADRPPEREILQILRENRAAIEAQVRRPPE